MQVNSFYLITLQIISQLGMLPLMYICKIADILFFIKSLKTLTDKLNILNYIIYVNFNTGSIRFSGTKLHHKST